MFDPFDGDFDRAGYDAAQNVGIDEGRAELLAEARGWARRVRLCAGLLTRAEGSPDPEDRRFLVLELAGSWHVSQVTAGRWLAEAARLTEVLPRTLALLESGALLAHQAKVVLHRTGHCTPQVAGQVETELLGDGPVPAAAGLCPSDLGKRIDALVLRIESETLSADAAEQRHADAAAERRVFSRPEPDGMALLGAVLTAEQQVAFSTGLDTLERRERIADREAGVDRTADQRRADLLAALPQMVLAGLAQDTAADADGQPRRPWTFGPEQLAATVVLNVHVPVTTVLDLSREPGKLDGYGPISAEHVRLLRPKAFRRVMADAHTGRPIAIDDRTTPADPDPATARAQVQQMLRPDVITDPDEPQHDPSARLARLIDVRDVHCCGPGCASSRTHRDHLEPWPTGPTSARNLGRLSARCHAAKHHGWTLQRHPDGSTTWTSPLHRSYHRPGPHQPPPKIDLYTDPPPLRPAPQTRPPWWSHITDPPPPTEPSPPPQEPGDDTPPF